MYMGDRPVFQFVAWIAKAAQGKPAKIDNDNIPQILLRAMQCMPGHVDSLL